MYRLPKKASKKIQNKREITGVCLIAFGLFLGVGLFAESAGILGKAISDAVFGMFGLSGYAIPVTLLIGGIAFIAFSKRQTQGVYPALIIAGIWCLLVIVHIFSRPVIKDIPYLTYCRDAYISGEVSKLGGGLLGSVLAYPALLLLGEAGSYILFIAAIVIVILTVTKLSLRDAGEQVGNRLKKGMNALSERIERKQELYTEDLTEYQDDRLRQLNNSRTLKPIVKNSEKEIEFLPMSGPIAMQSKQAEADIFGMDPIVENRVKAEQPSVAERVSRISNNAPLSSKPIKAIPVEHIEPIPPAAVIYQRPPVTLLNEPAVSYSKAKESPSEKARILVETFASFNISVKILNISVGPSITRYELQPAQGVRVNRITTLSDDIALALAAPRVRIEAPIPGKAAIGIEVPNKNTSMVMLREIVESPEFTQSDSPITFALGKDIVGKTTVADLDRMPHLLIAGTTGSGKSVCINNIIVSMIYKSTPAELRMILIDPKVVELKFFSSLPHLLVPVVTEPKKAAGALKWAVSEMESRYQKMAKLKARDIARFNALQKNEEDKLPKIVIVIDELADLMMVAAKDVEESICRIAQLGRACGIHLVVATQRPSADIITGLIKANIPSRIAFAVSSSIESRVIMDCNGAEKLLGRGDMLFHPNGAGKPVRVQGAYVSDEEVERVVNFFERLQPESNYDERALDEIVSVSAPSSQGNGKQEDELLSDAVKIILDSGQASISMLQRRLRIGYARAARLIDIMEQMNIVSGFDGSKPRKLLIDYARYDEIFGNEQEQKGS
ncbi:MAG: DNA translocase SpoIIIE [Firmicutes bacterium ADurb.Bin182]|nr:MAG: DNA translocase SpoIIIE [Firmicutes bacterium ADurb.Bin182]